MTEERKQELRQLLSEAMQSVIIEVPEGYKVISVEEYRECAKAFRKSYRPDLSFILEYKPNIQNDSVKSKLFNFMKEELAEYISEKESVPPTHWIQTSKRAIGGARSLIPISLDKILEKLLEIVTVSGVEQAILVLDRCTRDKIGTFQKIILLEGLQVLYSDTTKEANETHIAEGIKFVQLPSYPVGQIRDLYESEQSGFVELSSYASGLPPYLFHGKLIPDFFHENFLPIVDNTQSWFRQWSKFPMALHLLIFSDTPLLIIDYTVSPLFCRPSLGKKEFDKSDQFEIKIKSTELPKFEVDKFCQALSIIANYPVKSPLTWQFIGGDELFNVDNEFPNEMGKFAMPDFRSGIGTINENDIDKVKDLYKLLANPSSNIGEKLKIPIDRWTKSKAERNPVDKIIDLGIALESLYLSGTESKNEIRFRFSLHAAWHLGDNKEQRTALMKEFKEIYDWRSTVVHSGKLPEKGSGKKKKSYTPEEIRKFIRNAQDLCQKSILKILEDGEFPDWNDLILGEEFCTTNC